MRKRVFIFLCFCWLFIGVLWADDVVRPLNSKSLDGKEKSKETKEEDKKMNSTSWPSKSWLMPAEKISSSKYSELREEDPVGDYGQPRWTAHRRFANTRVYVRPKGVVDTEVWGIAKIKRHKKGETITVQAESEFGLPHRFQFDMYFINRNEHKKGKKSESFFDFAAEIRYALADWGEFWGNPTVYLEYKTKEDAADVFESKLLFGGEMTTRWHWGTNFIWEQELSRARACELQFTASASYTILDEKLSVGVETKSAFENQAGARDDWKKTFYAGPSVQFKPTKRTHIDFAPIFGINKDAGLVNAVLIFGLEL